MYKFQQFSTNLQCIKCISTNYLTIICLKNSESIGNYDFVLMKKNLQALAACGLSIEDAKSEILSLKVTNYYKGPKHDFDSSRPGDIWEFKKNIDGTQFYVKLKITQVNEKDILKCIGFHEDNFI